MSITVVGSIGIDTVETPFGKKEKMLGGAAVYFSAAASLYADVNLVGIVGTDFPQEYIELLKRLNIDIKGLETRPGETFSWHGAYEYDMNVRHSIDTRLGLFADFDPDLPAEYKASDNLFLANIDPELQTKVLGQSLAGFTMMDTMDFWINGKRESLDKVIENVDVVLMNDSEVRLYTKEYGLVDGARKILERGPRAVVVKKGEHGALLVSEDDCFSIPGYPLCSVKDPTGAGDSFAGGFLGYLSTVNDKSDPYELRNAIVHGSMVASFVVEDFSLNGILNVNQDMLRKRYDEFINLVRFDADPKLICRR